MKTIVKTAVMAGAVAALSITTANAATFVFKGAGNNVTPLGSEGVDFEQECGTAGLDYCSAGSHENGLNYSLDGIDLQVIATENGVPTRAIQDIFPGDSGLGAFSEENSSDDQTQADSNEAIELLFSESVALTDVEFNAGGDTNCSTYGSEGPCGMFNLTIDGVFIGSLTATDSLAYLGTGMHFIIEAITEGAGFTIAKFTALSDDVEAIPTPAALPLLLSGLLGLGFATRRRKDAAVFQ